MLLNPVCQINYSQTRENKVFNKYEYIKSKLEEKNVKAIALTRTLSSFLNLGKTFEGRLNSDSIVFSKDGTYYYRKLILNDANPHITVYKDSVLTINGTPIKKLPFFIKNANLFYSVFHVDDYDSCTYKNELIYDCKKNSRNYKLFFDSNQNVVKSVGTHENEFSDFKEIYGLNYPTKIKQRINEGLVTISGVIKINSLTVIKESAY